MILFGRLFKNIVGHFRIIFILYNLIWNLFIRVIYDTNYNLWRRYENIILDFILKLSEAYFAGTKSCVKQVFKLQESSQNKVTTQTRCTHILFLFEESISIQ